MFTKNLLNKVESLHDRNQMLAIIGEKSNQKIKLLMTVTSRIWSNYRRYQSLNQRQAKVIFTSDINLKSISCKNRLRLLSATLMWIS